MRLPCRLSSFQGAMILGGNCDKEGGDICHFTKSADDDERMTRGEGLLGNAAHQGRTVGPSRRKGPLSCDWPLAKARLFLENRSPSPPRRKGGLANAQQGPLAARCLYCASVLCGRRPAASGAPGPSVASGGVAALLHSRGRVTVKEPDQSDTHCAAGAA